MKTVKVSSLKVGDIVRLSGDEGYSCATVYQDDGGDCVHVWRPYVYTGDVLYSGGRVIPYIGLEDFALLKTQDVMLVREGGRVR